MIRNHSPRSLIAFSSVAKEREFTRDFMLTLVDIEPYCGDPRLPLPLYRRAAKVRHRPWGGDPDQRWISCGSINSKLQRLWSRKPKPGCTRIGCIFPVQRGSDYSIRQIESWNTVWFYILHVVCFRYQHTRLYMCVCVCGIYTITSRESDPQRARTPSTHRTRDKCGNDTLIDLTFFFCRLHLSADHPSPSLDLVPTLQSHPPSV